MDSGQNLTAGKNQTPVKELDVRQLAYIDYMALNGLIFDTKAEETNRDGTVVGTPMRKMSHQELADKLGVARQTLYDWRESIPDFWTQVNNRRMEISPKSRLARVHETWYLKAVKGEYQHMQLWLANFDPNFRMPTQKAEVAVSNSWAQLLATNQTNVVEGEVVEPTDHA